MVAVAHEQNSAFFKSKLLYFTAMVYKLVGGGMKINNSIQARVNAKLKEEGLIKEELSKEEIVKLVDYHSPVEQSDISMDRQSRKLF